MTGEELRRAVATHRWQHSLRLPDGIVTPGARSEAALAAEEDALFGAFNLRGAHVLDAGAAEGHFTFAALRRGARRVLSTDHLAWTLPNAGGEAALRLAAGALGHSVETLAADPRQVTGSFHVTLAMGFYEQSANPIAALRALSAATTHLMLLETLQDALDDARPMMVAHTLDRAYGPGIEGWAPNPPLVMHMLLEMGFDRVLYRTHPEGVARGIYAALRPAADGRLLEGFAAPWINMTHPTPPA